MSGAGDSSEFHFEIPEEVRALLPMTPAVLSTYTYQFEKIEPAAAVDDARFRPR